MRQKRLPFTLLYLFFIFPGWSSPRHMNEGIQIMITNLCNNRGHVLVSLYKDGVGYPDQPEKAVRKAKLSISERNAWVLFSGLPAGRYAVAILHDENDDQRMNKNFFGLPREGFGFSNNVMGRFGPPSFSRAAIYYQTDSFFTLQIKTKYW